MRWGGLALFLFVLFHLAHLTWAGSTGLHPTAGGGVPKRVGSFNEWWLVVIYVAAMIALCLHGTTGPGACSDFGVNKRRWDPIISAHSGRSGDRPVHVASFRFLSRARRAIS